MVSLMQRRRMMMQSASTPTPVPDIPFTITPLTGSGADRTSVVIDCTERAAYWTLPFVEGATQLVSTATAESTGCKIRGTQLFSDAECTNSVGFYQVDTGTITSSRGTSANSPWANFDTEMCVAPRGYYAKMMITKYGSAVWSSNANMASYINNYASTVLLRK